MTDWVEDKDIRKVVELVYGSADPTPIDIEAGLADVADRANIRASALNAVTPAVSRPGSPSAVSGSGTRILLGQRGRLIREALSAVLTAEDDLKVVAELSRVDEVLPAALRDQPHVAVLDVALPGSMMVTDLAPTLCTALPACGVLILLDRHSGAGVGRSLARLAPRVGFLGAETSPFDLVESVRKLARGEPVLDAEVAVAALTADENPLTDRECEVLRMALDGAPAKEIGQRLYLSAGTVRNYLSRILAKTGARTRIEAIHIARDSGWI